MKTGLLVWLALVSTATFARDVKVKDPARLRQLLSVCAEGKMLTLHALTCTRDPAAAKAECHFKCQKEDHSLTDEQAEALFKVAEIKAAKLNLVARAIECTGTGCQVRGVQ